MRNDLNVRTRISKKLSKTGTAVSGSEIIGVFSQNPEFPAKWMERLHRQL